LPKLPPDLAAEASCGGEVLILYLPVFRGIGHLIEAAYPAEHLAHAST